MSGSSPISDWPDNDLVEADVDDVQALVAPALVGLVPADVPPELLKAHRPKGAPARHSGSHHDVARQQPAAPAGSGGRQC